MREYIEEAIKKQRGAARLEMEVDPHASTESLTADLELAMAELRTLRAERDRLKTAVARSSEATKDLNARIQALAAANQTIAAERDRLREALKESEEHLTALKEGRGLNAARTPHTSTADQQRRPHHVMIHPVWNPEQIHDRLRELAESDADLRRTGARRHRYQLGPTVAEQHVARFESAHGISLPDSYRRFITTVGNGGAGPYYGMFRHDGSDWPAYLQRLEQDLEGLRSTTFPHTTTFQPWPEVKPCPRHSGADESYDPCWLAGTLALDEFGCGAFYRLVITGRARGQVWFDDLASDQGLTSGPDFHDWYLDWLENPPPPRGPATARMEQGEP